MIVEGNFFGPINGLRFYDDVLHETSLETAEITGWKYIKSVDAYTTTSRHINRVDIHDWVSKAIYKNVNSTQTVDGYVTMHNAKFYENVIAPGYVNGKIINKDTVLVRSPENLLDARTLLGNLSLISSQQAPSTIAKIKIAESLNGKDVNVLMADSFRSDDDVIDSKLIFDEPLEVENLETEAKIFGVDMDQFVRESGASRNLEQFQRDLHFLRKVGKDIDASFKDHAKELNHFEHIQSIPALKALNFVDFKILTEQFVAVHEKNQSSPFDTVKFYRWNRDKEQFLEDARVEPLKFNVELFEIIQLDKVVYANADHLFVELLDKSTNFYTQSLMIFNIQSQIFVPVVQLNSGMSTRLLTIGNGIRACYASFVIGTGNLAITCETSAAVILKTPPIKSIDSLNNLLIILVATNDTDSQIQVWRGERLVSALNILNPQSFTIAHHNSLYTLAVISGRVEKSTHHGSIEIFETVDDVIDFQRVQSFEVENPFKLRFSAIPTGDLLLYILTKQPGKALLVYVHAGASHFTKFIGDEVTIVNTGTDMTSISIDKQHEVVLILAKEIFVIKAVLKEF